MENSKLKEIILAEMEQSNFDVFLRSDFAHIGNYDRVGKALSQLCKECKLLRLGSGLYCLTEISDLFPGEVIPKAKSLPALAREALTRLGYQVVVSKAERERQEGRSTQVPTGRRLAIKGKQPNRKIGYDGTYVTYEHAK
ncbi:DUF6088 family protein [Chamaesiphon minutus]|uniref:S-adenosylhomocysteine hydrolase n=1 Tax=Chamaesiphon minutus (strain ATCC 27169 / PCC 6605) TaxID=1173020 RepID=K9UC89_CHAP6|nr:DUF6088 family protein [Chamaesiphon minutus]AFY92440.1 hypothetical protein Cha6605_1226 [Chamaesiphon minutus PCC 6605]